MKLAAIGLALLGLVGGIPGAAPCLADAPIAGARLFTVSHGQPFCTSKAQLEALLVAQVSQAPIGFGPYDTCIYVPDNTIVAVGQDLPGGRYMHIVRVRLNPFLGPVEGYTYSVGLYPLPVRVPFPYLNPFY